MEKRREGTGGCFMRGAINLTRLPLAIAARQLAAVVGSPAFCACPHAVPLDMLWLARSAAFVSMTPLRYDPHAEWLEADGLGGFTSGTVSLERTRRYHALLLAAIGERASRESGVPAGRYVLINGLEVWLENAAGDRRYLSTQFYDGEVIQPRGVDAITDFAYEPWPRWVFRCGEGGPVVAHELCVVRDAALTLLSWRLLDNGDAGGGGDNASPPWRLHV
ncbi:MAG: glycogen debranching enzyme N-terminal domain-containing protein, partial [Verrucomicrobia bacterium]|nr:glycogen debranching enzyme N-terminal domain-containing protein [Verrucomicrobiota bacterium]